MDYNRAILRHLLTRCSEEQWGELLHGVVVETYDRGNVTLPNLDISAPMIRNIVSVPGGDAVFRKAACEVMNLDLASPLPKVIDAFTDLATSAKAAADRIAELEKIIADLNQQLATAKEEISALNKDVVDLGVALDEAGGDSGADDKD